jgi:hypothetical protein
MLRKQRALNLGGQLEILFERLLLGRGETIEADMNERICHEALRLDDALTGFTETVSPLLHPIQCRIDLPQQTLDLRVSRGNAAGSFQPRAPIDQLFLHGNIFSSGHGTTPVSGISPRYRTSSEVDIAFSVRCANPLFSLIFSPDERDENH